MPGRSDMGFNDFMESFGRKGAEIQIAAVRKVPEHCLWCGHEFVYDIQPTTPPSMSTSCECGQWIIVVPEP